MAPSLPSPLPAVVLGEERRGVVPWGKGRSWAKWHTIHVVFSHPETGYESHLKANFSSGPLPSLLKLSYYEEDGRLLAHIQAVNEGAFPTEFDNVKSKVRLQSDDSWLKRGSVLCGVWIGTCSADGTQVVFQICHFLAVWLWAKNCLSPTSALLCGIRMGLPSSQGCDKKA